MENYTFNKLSRQTNNETRYFKADSFAEVFNHLQYYDAKFQDNVNPLSPSQRLNLDLIVLRNNHGKLRNDILALMRQQINQQFTSKNGNWVTQNTQTLITHDDVSKFIRQLKDLAKQSI